MHREADGRWRSCLSPDTDVPVTVIEQVRLEFCHYLRHYHKLPELQDRL
jgi:hypothetical protein